MEYTLNEVYYDVEKAIDFAFQGKFVLKFYDYLKIRETTKREVEEFIESKTVNNIKYIIFDLEKYLEGGSDTTHKLIREAYGYVSKPQARKIKDYLCSILNDAKQYYNDKGKRKRRTK